MVNAETIITSLRRVLENCESRGLRDITQVRSAVEVELSNFDLSLNERRFIITYGNGARHTVDQAKASWIIDMQDTFEEPVTKIEYVCDDGNVYPVTIGERERCNADQDNPLIYASAPLLVNGGEVGVVEYTDH